MKNITFANLMRFESGAGGIALRICLALLLGITCCVYPATNFDALQTSFVKRWGTTALPKFENWRKLVNGLADSTDQERIKRVNAFFNQYTRFGEDPVIWNQDDYWATPLETLGMGAGDCEDFVIAKYYTLLEAGVAPIKLRLIYVRAKTGVSDTTQAHMVLAYYANPEVEPLVLDNLISDIKPASRRPDLVPVFSFNGSGVFTGIVGGGTAAAGVGRLSRWEDLLRRAKAEGFE